MIWDSLMGNSDGWRLKQHKIIKTFYIMKFYETHYDDYDRSVKIVNFHPPFTHLFQNYVFYGPPGVGKYSQMIHLIKNFSPSGLKFENKIFSNVEKHEFFINISDIHYEVDMSLLGCNSKIIWHDIFLQITDIISLKPHKKGFIVCKNFHEIHNELLEIFYSYMNILSLRSSLIQRKFSGGSVVDEPINFGRPIDTDVNIKFIILTEHISFIPTNILNKCKIQSFSRPSNEMIVRGIGLQKAGFNKEKVERVVNNTDMNILNLKEVYSFVLMNSSEDIPKDNFVVICENIIEQIEEICGKKRNNAAIFANYAEFRDIIYDILVYNLDPLDAIRYIFFYFLKKEGALKKESIDNLLRKLSKFMFQYGNNYRSFFHLEYFLFSLMDSLRLNN